MSGMAAETNEEGDTTEQEEPLPWTAVEVTQSDGTTPGLVRQWRVDGFKPVHQERVVVATKRDGDVQEIDVPRSAVSIVGDPEAGIIRDMIPAEGERDE